MNLKVFLTTAGYTAAAAAGAIALAFGIGQLGLGFTAFFAPRQQAIQRQVFENTPSAVQGNIQDIRKFRIEYLGSTSQAQKLALAEQIRNSAGQIPPDRLPADLESFISTLE
jgi:hypothetical protein